MRLISYFFYYSKSETGYGIHWLVELDQNEAKFVQEAVFQCSCSSTSIVFWLHIRVLGQFAALSKHEPLS